MINRRRGRAVFQQIADILRDEITSGERPEGSALPSADLIRRTYNVSMTTAERVLGLLAAEGLIDTQSGRSARVRPLRVRETVWLQPGALLTARMPTPAEAGALGVPTGVGIVVVEYVGTEPEIYASDRWEFRAPGPVLKRARAADDPFQ